MLVSYNKNVIIIKMTTHVTSQ